ncbi:MAG: DnaB-like helicase C-terminal domain-containing protein [Thiolinea sp.]
MRNDKKVHLGGFNPLDVGKLPPQNSEMEEAVLGAVMLEKNVFAKVSTLLEEDDFYVDAHVRIFKAISMLSKKNNAIDILTVTNQLKANGDLETVGGAYYVSKLTNRVASSANVEYHARVVLVNSMLRKQILLNTQFINNCYEPDADPFELLSAQRSLLAAIEKHDDIDITPLARMKETVESIYKAQKNDGVSGVPLGIKKLTNFLGGAAEGDYFVFGARSGAFKSALMLWIQHHLSIHGIPTLMFQQEMTEVQTGVREIALKTGLETQNIKRGKLTDADWESVHKAVGVISDSKVFIDTTPNQKISTIKSKLQRAIDEHGIKVAVIDYLHLCDLEVKKHGNDEAAISQHCKEMKSMAKELKISILELAQFNKEAGNEEQKQLKPPHMGFFKGSGAIEYSADGVILFWNPAKIDENFIWEGVETKGKIAIIIAKNKNGETGMFWHGVKAASNQFFELDDNDYEPNKHIEPNFDFEAEEKPNILTK